MTISTAPPPSTVRPRHYPIPSDPATNDLIDNWRETMRYSATGEVNATIARRWAEAAARVYRATAFAAKLDGVLKP